jgi:hypothetical protein
MECLAGANGESAADAVPQEPTDTDQPADKDGAAARQLPSQ